MADSIRVRVLRPVHLGAHAREAGEVVTLPAADAARALESGRVALCDAADAARVRAAVEREVRHALWLERQTPAAPPPEPLWQRRH